MGTPENNLAPCAHIYCYCRHCGYDLRTQSSAPSPRCPECGRPFSLSDPKTFRPFAAPWKRTIGRWARRAAILLLLLSFLLAGAWGWLYWGWKQERAAAAKTRGEYYSVIRTGDARKWLYKWVPGSFVLRHVNGVTLPKTATDADLLPLPNLPELEALKVEGPITDAGLVLLARCPRLRFLTLFKARVTDAGLVHLAKLAALEWLDLSQTDISDAGLVHLEKLRTLQVLNLQGTKVTPAGVARLKAALPGCEIFEP